MSEMPSTDWLAIERAENTVFAQRRHGHGNATDWQKYLNAAQVVLSYAQDLSATESIELFKIERSLAVIAASRILDAAAESLARAQEENPARDEDSLAFSYSALAALGYATTGNFPAADTVLRRMLPLWPPQSEVMTAMVLFSAPRLLGHLYPRLAESPVASAVADGLALFLIGRDPAGTNLRSHLDALRPKLAEPFESSVWLSTRVVLQQLVSLSSAEFFREELPAHIQDVLARVVDAGFQVLLPPQYAALRESDILKDKRNALICLPTSTGKTLLAELCLFAHTAHGRIGFYVVPYVALGRQVADKIAEHLAPGWTLLRLFGGYNESIDLPSQNSKCIAVITPERLDGALRNNPALLQRTSCVVFDEAHTVASGDRGARLEGIIARILIQQSRGADLKLVLLSAVVPNAELLRTWINAPAQNTVTSTWTPSSKRLAVWSNNGTLAWFHSNDPLRPVASAPADPLATVQLYWPSYVRGGEGEIARQKYYAEANTGNVAYLLQHLNGQFAAPILCVCPTKEMTRKIAAACANRFPKLEELPAEIAKAVDLIATQHPQLTHLSRALAHGVAFHNASLPHGIRAKIEDAAKAMELKVVVSTTTLAEGIDLPFRATVLADWLTFGDSGTKPFSPLLVRNIAGRAGRAGYFTEGDLILYDNPVGDPIFKGPDKSKYLRQVLFSEDDPGLISPLAMSPGHIGIRGVIASQFLAAVGENADTENLEEIFFSHLLAARQENATDNRAAIASVSAKFEDPNWQLASRNSPLRLTDLGRAVSKSGFAPASTVAIRDALEKAGKVPDPIRLVTHLLESIGDLPEQRNVKFSKLVAYHKRNGRNSKERKGRPKFCVTLDDLPTIMQAWVIGTKPLEVFKTLPGVVRSKRKPPLAQWLAGLPEPSDWDDEFERFCDFQNDVFETFLPWLLRACELLSPFLRTAPQFADWEALAAQFEREQSSSATMSFTGFIADLRAMNPQAFDKAIDNKLSEAVHVLVDEGNAPEQIAGSNASGFYVDEYEAGNVVFLTDECRVDITWHATGDQHDEKPFTGDTLQGRATAVINDAGEVTFEEVSCKLVNDTWEDDQ